MPIINELIKQAEENGTGHASTVFGTRIRVQLKGVEPKVEPKEKLQVQYVLVRDGVETEYPNMNDLLASIPNPPRISMTLTHETSDQQ